MSQVTIKIKVQETLNRLQLRILFSINQQTINNKLKLLICLAQHNLLQQTEHRTEHEYQCLEVKLLPNSTICLVKVISHLTWAIITWRTMNKGPTSMLYFWEVWILLNLITIMGPSTKLSSQTLQPVVP